MTPPDSLVFIGRFQPPHRGHLATMVRALTLARQLIVVVGSARRGRNVKNPFTEAERAQMILAALDAAIPGAAQRTAICPVRDWYDNARWVAAVRRAVAAAATSGDVGLIGHAKDASTYYLEEFPDWPKIVEPNHEGLSATPLRAALFAPGGPDWTAVEAAVPAPVATWLHAFAQRREFTALIEEYAAVAADKAAWSRAPYSPVFVTVDAVVRCQDRLLMIRRGGHPGRGQWALPGGFVEQGELLRDAASRELIEETGIAVTPAALRAAQRGSAVFDHPDRSVRGRTITHAYYYELPDAEPPAVIGTDDAAEAAWVPIAELANRETEIFEDHLHVANRFLDVVRD